MTPSQPDRSADLAKLLKLYTPNVGQGNFQGDVHARGRNAALVAVAEALGIATKDEMLAEFVRLNNEAWERDEARRANAT